MSALASEATLCGQGFDGYRSEAVADEALISVVSRDRQTTDGWRACVRSLRQWRLSPPDWDEGIVVPSRGILQLAEEIALILRQRGQAEPMRVLPDGEGGVVFERRQGQLYETLGVMADGCIELKRFRSGSMIFNEHVSAHSIL